MIRLIALSALLLFPLPSCGEAIASTPRAAEVAAVPANGAGPGGPRGEFRQKSRDACKSKKDGDTCSFEGPGRTISGHCRPAKEGLACIPKRMEERRKAARKACEGKKTSDACTVTSGERSRDGTCQDGPQGLACRIQHKD